jgi:hypothetical protein
VAGWCWCWRAAAATGASTAAACARAGPSSLSHLVVGTGVVQVQVATMGSQKCRIVGKSQPVLIMTNPMIATRTRRDLSQTGTGRSQSRWKPRAVSITDTTVHRSCQGTAPTQRPKTHRMWARPAPPRAAHLDGRADSGAVANLADSGARGVAATPISSERPPTRPPPSSAAYLPPPRTQAGRQAQGRAGIQ